MALSDQELKFFLAARKHGVSLERFCMIGRQALRIDPGALRKVLHEGGIVLTSEETQALYVENQGFAEPVLRLLGASEIESIDASTYEQASIVHDMNQPIPETLKNRFTAVLDGGSLEHVFHFPRAIANCLEMVAVGGHFLAATPANNWMGHGFYQFSPELFFRILTPENGFALERMIAVEQKAFAPWYEVMDPARAGGRVKLTNHRPTCLLVQAARSPRFRSCPSLPNKATTPPSGTGQTTEAAVQNQAASCRTTVYPPSAFRLQQSFRSALLPKDGPLTVGQVDQAAAERPGGFTASRATTPRQRRLGRLPRAAPPRAVR